MNAVRATLLAGVAALAPAVLPGQANAQTVSGLYIAGAAGANWWMSQSSGNVQIDGDKAGWVVLGSIGYGFGNGLRLEAEGSWRGTNSQTINVAGVSSGTSGRINQYGAMANVLFDFDLSSWGVRPTDFMPYVGAGVGMGWFNIPGARYTTGASTYRIDDTSSAFAYQAIAGAAFGFGGLVPGLALTAEYRFYGTREQSLNNQRVAGPAVAGVPATLKLDNTNHAALLGLRYSFNTPPAPAPAPAVEAPAPARTYLVFFDWDRADLTDRARQIIAEAAENSRRIQTTRIEVAGHADRSGSAEYNQRLSLRRANVVAAELVRRGVERGIITIQAFGESRPLVPTADGVREPQNRRVEIVLR